MIRRERFEFMDAARGPCSRLVWNGFEVVLAEWPGSLLAMLRAGVLGHDAAREARAAREASG